MAHGPTRPPLDRGTRIQLDSGSAVSRRSPPTHKFQRAFARHRGAAKDGTVCPATATPARRTVFRTAPAVGPCGGKMGGKGATQNHAFRLTVGASQGFGRTAMAANRSAPDMTRPDFLVQVTGSAPAYPLPDRGYPAVAAWSHARQPVVPPCPAGRICRLGAQD